MGAQKTLALTRVRQLLPAVGAAAMHLALVSGCRGVDAPNTLPLPAAEESRNAPKIGDAWAKHGDELRTLAVNQRKVVNVGDHIVMVWTIHPKGIGRLREASNREKGPAGMTVTVPGKGTFRPRDYKPDRTWLEIEVSIEQDNRLYFRDRREVTVDEIAASPTLVIDSGDWLVPFESKMDGDYLELSAMISWYFRMPEEIGGSSGGYPVLQNRTELYVRDGKFAEITRKHRDLYRQLNSGKLAERVKAYDLLAATEDFGSRDGLVILALHNAVSGEGYGRYPAVYKPFEEGDGPFSEMVMERLFDLVKRGRPHVWPGAVRALHAMEDRWEDPELFERKKNELTGYARLRMMMYGPLPAGARDEVQSMEYAASFAVYDLADAFDRYPAAFRRACMMASWSGEKGRHLPKYLARALQKMNEGGKCSDTSLAACALKAINVLTGKQYGGLSGGFDHFDLRRIAGVDWAAVVAQLGQDGVMDDPPTISEHVTVRIGGG